MTGHAPKGSRRMTVAETLRAARSLIDTPEKWSKFELARIIDGTCTWTGSDEAHRFCALGAVVRLMGSAAYGSRVEDALDCSVPPGFACASDFNDSPDTTHADVLALYDRAIAAVEAAA